MVLNGKHDERANILKVEDSISDNANACVSFIWSGGSEGKP